MHHAQRSDSGTTHVPWRAGDVKFMGVNRVSFGGNGTHIITQEHLGDFTPFRRYEDPSWRNNGIIPALSYDTWWKPRGLPKTAQWVDPVKFSVY